ncbi:hypothetical protein [Bordetella sp. LUAb4]|uniref:hypothetical protein n=1 Tax=Bordetella sp. LUAb4 TaxID=2843195 RepID=UPI001E350ED4|nr:hypothetical protein [Bordetella sp. LUAb4]
MNPFLPSTPSSLPSPSSSSTTAQPASSDILIFGVHGPSSSAGPRLVGCVVHSGSHVGRAAMKRSASDHQRESIPARSRLPSESGLDPRYVEEFFANDFGVGRFPVNHQSCLPHWQDDFWASSWNDEFSGRRPISPPFVLSPRSDLSPLLPLSPGEHRPLCEFAAHFSQGESSEVGIIGGQARMSSSRQSSPPETNEVGGSSGLTRSDYVLLASMKEDHPYVAMPDYMRRTLTDKSRAEYEDRVRKLNHFVEQGWVTLDGAIDPFGGDAYLISGEGRAVVAWQKALDAVPDAGS